MEWVPLKGGRADISDKPRKMTNKEIEYVISHVPLAPSADPLAAEITRQGVASWIKGMLRDVVISPSAIPELTQRIVEQHYKSLVAPGTPVGITAAEAVGATTTQMTLNSVAPDELIFLSGGNGDGRLLKIGEWIDQLLENNPSKIVLIPENRTQYLELDSIAFVASPDATGAVTWSQVTAVTKHLPVGNLVKLKTSSGREVTVTKSKSILTYNGEQLIQEGGDRAKPGTLVPILWNLPSLNKHTTFVDCGSQRFVFTPDFGFMIGLILSQGTIKNGTVTLQTSSQRVLEWCKFHGFKTECSRNYRQEVTCIHSEEFASFLEGWLGVGDNVHVPEELLLSTPETVISVLDGFLVGNGTVTDHDSILFTPRCASKQLIQGISFLCSRLGIFGNFEDLAFSNSQSYRISGEDAVVYKTKVGSSDDELLTRMNCLKGKKRRNPVFGNVLLDTVKTVEEVSPTEFVYDLTVPSTTNFSLFNGLGVADTFHSSGSSKSVSFGIDAIRDIIYARKNPKKEACIIYFKDTTMTFEEVLATRIYIVGSVVSDFVKDYDIDKTENFSKFWWHAHSEALYDQVVPEGKMCLRLHLNVDALYKYRVSMKDLADTLQREMPPSLVAIYGPISDGIIDLYPSKQIVGTDLDEQLAQIAFFENIVIPEFPSIRVKGINGIRDLTPVATPVLSMVLHERPLTQEDVDDEPLLRPYYQSGRSWLMYYNSTVMRSTGLTQANLARLCLQAGVNVVQDLGIALLVESEQKPSDVVLAAVARDRKAREEQITTLTEERLKQRKKLTGYQGARLMMNPLVVPRSELMQAAEFVHAETSGANLRDVLGLPTVDKTRTTCNNMFTIAATLGIEAARSYAIRALIAITSNASSYVHPANITLIAEFITSRGEPHGATYSGISRQPGGHLSLASLERAGQVFTQSALIGRKEDIRNVSASVAVGARMTIGDGFFDVAQDITVDGAKKTLINEDLFTGFLEDDNLVHAPKQEEQDVEDALKLLRGLNAEQAFDMGEELRASFGDLEDFDAPGTEDNTNLVTMFVNDVETRNGKITSSPDVLAEVKVGIPLTEKMEVRKPVPVLSKALVELTSLTPPPVALDTQPLQKLLDTVKLRGPTMPRLARTMLELRGKQVGELK